MNEDKIKVIVTEKKDPLKNKIYIRIDDIESYKKKNSEKGAN